MIGPMCVISLREARALQKYFDGDPVMSEERDLLYEMRVRLRVLIGRYDKDEIMKDHERRMERIYAEAEGEETRPPHPATAWPPSPQGEGFTGRTGSAPRRSAGHDTVRPMEGVMAMRQGWQAVEGAPDMVRGMWIEV